MSQFTANGRGSTGHPDTKGLAPTERLKHLVAFSAVGLGAGAAGMCLALTLLFGALFTCVLAAFVAKLGLGGDPQYHAADFHITAHLPLWCAIFGPVFGGLGMSFKRLTQHAQGRSPLDAKMFLACALSFSFLGLLSVSFPELLGNGKVPAQLAFDGHMSLEWGLSVISLKLIVVVLALLSGAKGGLMTPAIAIGALVASVLGIACCNLSPLAAAGPYAIVGAAAFLSSSMAMPLMAIVLLVEIMHLPLISLMPLGLAVAGATVFWSALQHAATLRTQQAEMRRSGSHVVRPDALGSLLSVPQTRTIWTRLS
ncbi:chloride channel protein [Rhizobium cauense]|uniref:chloride channel protein n=1 Tax=Rhizobium cauense TaxID=1166683 RepID=UPI001C6EE602|nr:chloride channel protein [Rhizobium cauense]MBW9116866.1 chloride channel protein [Rhizobium cauense]